jgi:hypothetical protein
MGHSWVLSWWIFFSWWRCHQFVWRVVAKVGSRLWVNIWASEFRVTCLFGWDSNRFRTLNVHDVHSIKIWSISIIALEESNYNSLHLKHQALPLLLKNIQWQFLVFKSSNSVIAPKESDCNFLSLNQMWKMWSRKFKPTTATLWSMFAISLYSNFCISAWKENMDLDFL